TPLVTWASWPSRVTTPAEPIGCYEHSTSRRHRTTSVRCPGTSAPGDRDPSPDPAGRTTAGPTMAPTGPAEPARRATTAAFPTAFAVIADGHRADRRPDRARHSHRLPVA